MGGPRTKLLKRNDLMTFFSRVGKDRLTGERARFYENRKRKTDRNGTDGSKNGRCFRPTVTAVGGVAATYVERKT